MAKLSRDDVLKLAALARLELTEEEIKQYQTELSDILDYVELLQGVDVSNLEPTYQVTGLKSVTRPDVVRDYGTTVQDLLKNVPAVENNQIKVKRVL